ncbi:hypothetical protein TNCV_2054211 [Trichonephila clavipes]|nr:hypothetical protein TNCV_2054211 [Trichonephila clavipes]
MATPGSSFTPTPLGHEENIGVGQPSWANALQWHPKRFNFLSPEIYDESDFLKSMRSEAPQLERGARQLRPRAPHTTTLLPRS